MAGSLRRRSAAAAADRDLPRHVRQRPKRRARWFAATAAVVISATACGGSSSKAQPTAATSTPPASASASTSSPASAEAVILADYRAFWMSLTPASQSAPDQRRRMLSPHTGDPELGSLLAGMARDDADGRVYYGSPVLRALVQQFSPAKGVAVVRDCQDASNTGDKDRRTGRLLTKGKARTLVVSTLHRTSRGGWKVVFVSFPRQSC